MRTKGRLDKRPNHLNEWVGYIVGKAHCLAIKALGHDDPQNVQNLDHAIACWNLVEDFGGDPEKVRDVLKAAKKCANDPNISLHEIWRAVAALRED